jgi:hypothetical protein
MLQGRVRMYSDFRTMANNYPQLVLKYNMDARGRVFIIC